MTYINNTAGQCSVCMRSSRYISIQLFSNTVGLVKYPHSFQFVCLTCMRVIVGVYACACIIAYPMLEPDSAYWLALAPFSVRQFFF